MVSGTDTSGTERQGRGTNRADTGRAHGTTPPARRPEFHDMDGNILLRLIDEERSKLNVKKNKNCRV